jgi:excinuclease ABC subunit C
LELINNKKTLQEILNSLPNNPGVYRFFDNNHNILYIGKAKNLKKRVYSYFSNIKDLSGKIKVLVKKISSIEYIIVESEYEALLLENTLIKEYQPRYNVMLKDDKTYPWICIKKEPFPRVFITRNYIRDGSEYFGPYASVKMIQTLFELIRKLYQLRTCRLNLTQTNIDAKKFKVCLEYHIGNCLAPCIGNINNVDYYKLIDDIREILKGNIYSVTNHLKKLMATYSDSLEFEKAQIVKDKLILLERYKGKSTVVNPNIHNVDVFNIICDENSGYVNYLKVVNGSVVQAHTLELLKKLDETPKELLLIAIADLRKRFNSNSNEIIVPFELSLKLQNIFVTVPQRGDKKHLLDLSESNVRHYMFEKNKHKELADPNRHSNRILEKLKKDLKMPVLPERIECFDNSNFQGDFAVAAMVCFINGKPDKNEYRHFNIKSVEGPNDYASMEEVVYRRYKRRLDEKLPLPQLIIIDGGKGQLSSAIKSLEKLNLRGNITIIGIAKKLEEIYFPDDSIPLYIDKKSESLKLIQRLRDEAHRFGITHHRNKRDKSTLKTELTDIKSIGSKTAELLLKKFKSVKGIASADISDIEKIAGKAKALIISEYFKKS